MMMKMIPPLFLFLRGLSCQRQSPAARATKHKQPPQHTTTIDDQLIILCLFIYMIVVQVIGGGINFDFFNKFFILSIW